MGSDKYNFQKLTPVSNVDISVYEDAIDFVFGNVDVKNVAISGAYSAGKSSILESYKSKHLEKRFLHISLAHFRDHEQENAEDEEMVKESILEGKILNQLIHQIPSEKIPQTNFRVKKGVDFTGLALLTAFICLFFGSIAFLMIAEKISSYVGALPDNWVKTVLTPLASPYAVIPMTFIIVVCFIAFIFSLIKVQKNKNVFHKISLQGNEIEIFEEKEDSYFDKYLNEVLYLFENVGADVIVFEDMDRFNVNRIFERLREVNTLVNIQRKNEKGGKFAPLRFFYLLRDDIFISKDRTKFFDYIIPVVPVVDSSNSYEQFLKHLKEGGLLEKFDQSFLQGVSLYINDMRILKNIYNEFIVYFNRLNTTDLDCNRMMAMIAYKNLFPRDFSDLQIAQGFIYELLSLQKERLIDSTVSLLQNGREELKNGIEWAKKEALDTQQELDDAYEAKKKRIPRDYNGRIMVEGKKLIEIYDNELPKRKQAIQDKIDGNIPVFEAKLAQMDRDIILTRTQSLSALITRENIDTVFNVTRKNEIGEINEFKEIKGSDYFALLKYLIRYGFIDETYADYMTYFYEGSLSINDKTFLRRITDRRGAEYSYTLKEPKKVIESPVLRQVEFEQEETLNFDLFECLLHYNTEPKYKSFLKTLITQIKRSENFEFISKYYDTGKERRNFVIQINELWPEFFSASLENKVFPDRQVRNFSIDTLCYSDNRSIKAINIDNCLTKYISNSTDYLAIKQPDIQKLISGFLLIDVLFVNIDYEISEKSLFDEVYQNSLYELNFENIALMLLKEYVIDNDNDIKHKNFSLIKRQYTSPLMTYVSKSMSSYIDIVLKNCSGKISDDQDVVIDLLNNSDINSSEKKQYINLVTNEIQDITKVIDSMLWTDMLIVGIVVFTENNFINYFIKHEIDRPLVNYLNAAAGDVDFTHTSDEFGENVAKQLFDAIIVCNILETSKYIKILIDLGYYFDNYDADSIFDEKINVLIREGIIRMDVEGLEYIRKNYSKHVYSFIEQNIDEYLELQTVETFNLAETLEILLWDFTDDKKIKLLSLTDEPISMINKGYSDNVCAYLIAHNIDPSNKVYLYSNYSTYGMATQNAIQTLVLSEVDTIITQNILVDDELLSVLLCSKSVARDQKITLFAISILKMNEDTCKNHLDELELFDLKNIFTRGGSRRKYNKNNDVTAILEILKTYGWIYNYLEDHQNSDKYLIIKNKPKEKEPEFLD